MTHYSKVVSGLRKYVNDELVAPVAGTAKGLLVFMVGGLVEKRANEIMAWLSAYKPAQIARLVAGENVDVDLMMDLLREYMRQYDGFTYKLPVIDLAYTFRMADVDALERYIKGGMQA